MIRINKGMTLTELLIVIAIIGIMAAVTVPTVATYLPGIQLNGSARSLSSNLREAQERAVTEQKQFVIRFLETTPASYKMIRKEGEVETDIETVTLPYNVNIELDPTIENREVVFSADGGATGYGNVTLKIDAKNKVVNISHAGFIKITN